MRGAYHYAMKDADAHDIPPSLATMTDLAPHEIGAVAAAVNPLIADAFALYVKTKNYHWHLSGRHFRDYHLLFDEQAESILESIDMLAERVRRIGALTIRSIREVAMRQSIEDETESFVRPLEMIRRLMNDNDTMARAMRAAIGICDKNRDTPTGNLLQEILDQTERRKWFLFEILQDETGAVGTAPA